MTRRSPPNRTLDERAFPVRVKVVENIHGPDWLRLSEAQAWLREHVGAGNYATHTQPGFGAHTRAFYFRTTADAHRFAETFAHFVLADGTESLDHLRQAKHAVANPRPYSPFVVGFNEKQERLRKTDVHD
jgi:hypothetical protein